MKIKDKTNLWNKEGGEGFFSNTWRKRCG
jgi:hypothetical protein